MKIYGILRHDGYRGRLVVTYDDQMPYRLPSEKIYRDEILGVQEWIRALEDAIARAKVKYQLTEVVNDSQTDQSKPLAMHVREVRGRMDKPRRSTT